MKLRQIWRIILWAGWIASGSLLFNQASGQPYYFRHYQVENGLSNNTVFCSAQDSRGFIWLGTKDGLDRFNGYSFKEFRGLPPSSELGDSFIRTLIVDTTGRTDTLYVGTRIGVYQFDPITEHFSQLLKTNGEVDALLKDKSGNLWVISDKTLTCINGKDHQAHTFSKTAYFQATSLAMTTDGQIWVSSAEGQLYHYDPKDPENPFIRHFDLFHHDSHLGPKWIEKIFISRRGLIYAGTSNFGVRIFDPTTKQIRKVLDSGRYAGIFVRDFEQVSDTSIWIATETGLFIYQPLTGKLVNLKQKTGDPYSLSDNAVYTLTQDAEGGIWVGTYSGGVNYYPTGYNTFQKYFAGQGDNSLNGNVVREIVQDKTGKLWIGTEDGGLNCLDPGTNKMKHFLAAGHPSDIAYPNVHGLLTWGDTLLIGTFEHGLDLMNIHSGKVFAHYPDHHLNALRSSFMITFCKTRSGKIYAGTRLGIYSFQPSTGVFTPEFAELNGAFIHAMMEDVSGKLWIATMGSGLYRYDRGKKIMDHFYHEATDSSSIPNNWITTVFQDSRGKVWVGTEGGGLCCMTTDGNGFIHYSSQDGLSSNTIYKLLEDNSGMLWISTSRGLVRFDPSSHQASIFTTANGLLSDQFNYNSGYKDRHGRMYFGSVKGLISFNPNTFKSTDFVPPIYLTEVQAAGQLVATWGDLITPKDGGKYAEIRVPHRHASLSIEFAALSYTAPEMTQYKYKLDGLDDKWTYLKTNRKVYFTNLAPGRYTFRVRGTNSSGQWNGPEAVLSIEILPTFWESRLAYTLYILLGCAIAYLGFRYYHDRTTEKNKRRLERMAHEKEKELYEAKLNFFTHVTHEIKTPLTLIKAPLEKILKKIDTYPGIRKYILMMQRNTSRMESLSGQLLDFRKTEVNGFRLHYEKTNINDLLRTVLFDFQPAATEKGLKFNLTLTKAPLLAEVDKESMIKILSNLIDNGVKYARSLVHIEVTLHPLAGAFSITIENDGQRIPAAFAEKLFEPFFRMESAKGQSGAGLGLALSRSLASLQGGSLTFLETNSDNIIFVLRLPLERNGVTEK